MVASTCVTCAPGSSARLSVSASGTASNPPTGCDGQFALEQLQIRGREAGARGVVNHDPVVVARARGQRTQRIAHRVRALLATRARSR